MQKIDFVVTWVDGSDSSWIMKKNKYLKSNEQSVNRKMNTEVRYRDWGIFKYWFRSVEKYAPWVNKVYLVTDSQVPDWINKDCEKLEIVEHSSIIDTEYLPTFNSCAIEWNLSNIPNLSEKFVYFNDDMFLNDNVEPRFFFKNDLPKDMLIFGPIIPSSIAHVQLNNITLINSKFNKYEIYRKHPWKIFNVLYGKQLVRSISTLPWNSIYGIYDTHLPISYLKSTFSLVADEIFKNKIDETKSHKFRTDSDLSHWLVRYWQLCSGKFHPRKLSDGNYYDIDKDFLEVLNDIKFSKHKIICINDSDNVDNFENKKSILIDTFKKVLSEKSIFEK